ncbi:MAG: GGDEF domain-containing protein, partial [Gammaproteobacteria bacterium]|nr:GGDEF domain-containing protein [Gammaproteobacteria bacterium]
DHHLYMSPGYAQIAGLGVEDLRSKIKSGADYVKCIYEQDRERARKLYNSCRDDLDGFKNINDRFGHEFGDCVLKATAERITSEIRETDTVARIGGDEFVIILSSLPECNIANRIATSLIEEIAQPIVIDQFEVAVSASIGISLYPKNGVTAEELIRSADQAMYQVKHAGKNSFGFAVGNLPD